MGYLAEPCADHVRAAVETVLAVHAAEAAGDILVFLAGKAEIEAAAQGLAPRAGAGPLRLCVLALHSAMPMAEQLLAFRAAPAGHRKVVLATNLAETSVTIEGIVFVVDGGWAKRRLHDPALDIGRMATVRISQSSALQRAGRAGRSRPGRVFRLYTAAEHAAFPAASAPELQVASLVQPVLQLKALGIDNLAGFDFVDRPPLDSLAGALRSLHALGALDDRGALTAGAGTVMAELPVEPAHARMLLASVQHGCTAEALTVVAVLAAGDVFFRDVADDVRRRQCVEEGDLVSYLNIYTAYLANRANAAKWCQRHGLVQRNLHKAEAIRDTLVQYLRRHAINPLASSGSAAALQKTILAGQFANLAKAAPDGTFRLVRHAGAPVALAIHPESALFQRVPEWVVFGEAIETTKVFMRDVTVVDKAWAMEVAPHYFKAARR